jgi:hypothetical protein
MKIATEVVRKGTSASDSCGQCLHSAFATAATQKGLPVGVVFLEVGREATRQLWRAAATNLGEPSQLPPGTFLNKSSPRNPTDNYLPKLQLWEFLFDAGLEEKAKNNFSEAVTKGGDQDPKITLAGASSGCADDRWRVRDYAPFVSGPQRCA